MFIILFKNISFLRNVKDFDLVSRWEMHWLWTKDGRKVLFDNNNVKNLNLRRWDGSFYCAHHDRENNVSINLKDKGVRLLTVRTGSWLNRVR